MKQYLFLVLIIATSCRQHDNNSNESLIVKSKDSVYIYYKNGNLNSKGKLTDNKQKTGWWIYYDTKGNLDKKIEFKYIDSILYQNQIISYTDNKVNEQLSSFFEIEIKDTLVVGKNIGKIVSYTSDFYGSDHLISVIVDNEYSDGRVKKDTFSDGTLNPKFGIYSSNIGMQKISLVILEEVLNEVEVSEDSSFLNILKHKKYFDKTVYVMDTMN